MPIPTNSNTYTKTDPTYWDVMELKRVVRDAIAGDGGQELKHFRAVFGPATVLWLLTTLERFLGDDMR